MFLLITRLHLLSPSSVVLTQGRSSEKLHLHLQICKFVLEIYPLNSQLQIALAMASGEQAAFIADRRGERIERGEGSLGGSDLAVERIEDCTLAAFDRTSQVQLDDAVGCEVVLGPCEGSVFVRDCSDCVVRACCRQLRARGCKRVRFELFCPSHPSIEDCSELTFSYWRTAYPGLTRQVQSAGFPSDRNNFAEVYDFSHNAGCFTIDDSPLPFHAIAPVECHGAGAPECPFPLPSGESFVEQQEQEPVENAMEAKENGGEPANSKGILERILEAIRGWLGLRGAGQSNDAR